MDLLGTLSALRQGQSLQQGQKVLIVLDQFEQWLHARRGEPNTTLGQALRQCDGDHVQCVVLVRDDFWLALSRFMGELQIELVQGQNIALVDLFDLMHARSVLAAFGRAFGRITDKPSPDQEAFLDQAVEGLAQDGRVISVRLALFAEMVKAKIWTPATWREVGGAKGVGVTFLEETFSNPKNRPQQKAARSILKALLPEQGTDIKGNMKARDELVAVSEYAGRPKEFEEFLRLLDNEVRLITPTTPEGKERTDEPSSEDRPGQKYYQLTHDYLVPSLREWLTRKQKESRRGRAELRLEDRAALWNAKPESQQLPSWWEWANIRLLTKKKDWTPPQRKMMRAATRHHTTRVGFLAVCLTLLSWGGWEGIGHLKAQALRDRLLNASTADVPVIVPELAPYRRWVDPMLREAYRQAEQQHDRRKQLHLSLALVPVDAGQVAYLYRRLLDAEPHEVAVIREALQSHKDRLTADLWAVVEAPAKGKEAQRLRAAAALASYDPTGPGWDKVNGMVVDQLIAVSLVHVSYWIEGLRPVRDKLQRPLAEVFRDHRDERAAERAIATSVLADYDSDQPEQLADLLLDADEKQFAVLFPKAAVYRDHVVAAFQRVATVSLESEIQDDARERLAKQQANAGVALLCLGQVEKVWPLFRHRPDPRTRSYLIHRLRLLGVDPRRLVRRLDEETDLSVRRALLLSLGEFGPESLANAERQPLIFRLLDIYRNDPDPGIHGATGWLLRQWKQQAQAQMIDRQLATGKVEGERGWYVNGQGQTMVVVRGPAEFLMGSPRTEAERYGGPEDENELQHRMRIERSFAIAATEVTVSQFLLFRKTHHYSKVYAATPDHPINSVRWYDAAAYCNWLSEREGIPEAEWCYEPNKDGEYTEGMKVAPDYLKRTGYRLPSEAEWEYACRAGAVTSRYFGERADLLGYYAWYSKNLLDRRMLPVGSLKPNDLGLFDMNGNAYEWIQEPSFGYRAAQDGKPTTDAEDTNIQVLDKLPRVIRGGSLSDQASDVRSAFRGYYVPSSRNNCLGIRLARTFR